MAALYLFAFIGLVVVAIAATVLTENEKFGWATALLVISVVLGQWLHVFNLVAYASQHAVATLLYAVGYVVVGIAWSFVKWFSFLMGARDKYRDWKIRFLTGENLDPTSSIPAGKAADFKKFIQQSNGYSYHDPVADLVNGKRPRAANNKARIVSWMSLWPCSFVGTLLNDPVRRLFNYLFNAFKSLYQKMSDKVFSKDGELN
jgi:hypothetical protein